MGYPTGGKHQLGNPLHTYLIIDFGIEFPWLGKFNFWACFFVCVLSLSLSLLLYWLGIEFPEFGTFCS